MYIHVYVYVSIVYVVLSYVGGNKESIYLCTCIYNYDDVFWTGGLYYQIQVCRCNHTFIRLFIHSFCHKSNMFKGHMHIQTYSYLRYVLQFSKVLNVCRYKSYI